MLRRLAYYLVIIVMLVLSGCQSLQKKQMQQEIKNLQHADLESVQYYQPKLTHLHLGNPPQHLALLVFKQSKTLQVYAKDKGAWQYLNQYRILAASGHAGPKLHQGDHQVPEGIYQIVALNPLSSFDLSMELNYPNPYDHLQASLSHRKNLGDNIFIHGGDHSVGCIAIGNLGIQRLYPLVAKVGLDRVTVIIAPNDLRQQKPLYEKSPPQWLPFLYAKIKAALSHYPLPPATLA